MESAGKLNDKTVENLSDLAEINLDSAKGFRKAAEAANGSLPNLFLRFAPERERFAEELNAILRANGSKPETSGSWQAKVHRWWMDMRASVQSNEEHAILAEAERGEDSIKGAYEDALKHNPGSAVSDLLHRQLRSIKAAHDEVRNMRDSAKARSK
ncbi:MAG: PA2169 family four-helix-bundle protein [Planctomycetota bacterium]